MTEHFQFVFVGSGVAATTVSKRLLEKNSQTSILMLDAGPKVEAKKRRYWWDYLIFDRKPYDYCYDIPGENDTVGNIDWVYPSSRVMAYGGSTMHWGAWAIRYKPEDFNLYSNTQEGADWPIEYTDLSPPDAEGTGKTDYYFEAENYLSVCGDDSESWNQEMRSGRPYPRPDFGWTEADGAMIEGFEECGIEPGKMPIARYRKCMTTGTCKYCPFGSRFNAQYVLDELLAEPRYCNLEQRCRATVTRVVTGGDGDVEAIEYIDRATGETHTVTADTYVLAAGTYECSKLLMRSTGPKWENGVGNKYDLVGRHIVSHSFLRVKGRTTNNKRHWLQEYDFPTLMSRTYDSPSYQKDGKIFLFKNRVTPNVDIARLMMQGKSRGEIDDVLGGPMDLELQAFYEEKGQFQNRLIPKPGTNKFGLPLTRIEYQRDPRFPERATKLLGLMNDVFKAMDYEVVQSYWDDPSGHHATSTCRMGETPEDGVTDRDMKVFGTSNLFVCSNAAFPSCTAVNPTLTLTAMSLRLGDHLIQTREL